MRLNGLRLRLRSWTRGAALRSGLDIQRYRPERDFAARRLRFLRELAIDAVIDGGASEGSWAQRLRDGGYAGCIVSFEPLDDPYSTLHVASASDPLWQCVQAALGDADGEAQMSIARNSVSSSLLPMESAHVRAAPQSTCVGTENVRVVRLDSIVPSLIPSGARLALKLDLQGYESIALSGAAGILEDVHFMECELSTIPLYRGQALYREMLGLLDGLGFGLVSISEGFLDPATGRVLQMNGLFARQDSCPTNR